MNRFSARREVTLGLLVYAAYLLIRWVVLRADGRPRARRNAERIVALQERLGLDVEPALQRAVLRFPRAVHGLNVGYAVFNVTLTVGWIVLLYRRRDPEYHRLRPVSSRISVRSRSSSASRRSHRALSRGSWTRSPR